MDARIKERRVLESLVTDIALGFVCLYTAISWAEWIVYCKPIAGFWNRDLKPTCLPVLTHKGFALMNTCKPALIKLIL